MIIKNYLMIIKMKNINKEYKDLNNKLIKN